MIITWHNLFTVKISTPSATLVLDPHAKTAKLPGFRSKAHLVALSNPNDPTMSYLQGIQGTPTIIDTPGEYSFGGITLYAIGWQGSDGAERSIQRWHIENMVIVHLAALDRQLSNAELQQLEQTAIDILLLPIADRGQWSLRTALATLTVIEPRLVVPINFTSHKDFVKQMGVSGQAGQSKLAISRHKLPSEGVETVVLQP